MLNDNQPSLTKKPAKRRLVIKEKNSISNNANSSNNIKIVTIGKSLPDNEIKENLQKGLYFI